MNRKTQNLFLSSLICLILLFQLTACQNSSNSISNSGYFFNTVITITLYDTNDQSKIDECFAIAKHYENLLSNTIETSDISLINQHAGHYVEVAPDTIEVLEKALIYCQDSNNTFDITIGKLIDLWDFSNVSAQTQNNDNEVDYSYLPDAKEISSLISYVDYHAIDIKDNKVCLSNPNAKLDLGAIAKGYIADKMKNFLNQSGITTGTINLGGNVLTLGPKENKESYKIGIQKPFSPTGDILLKLYIDDKSIVTSGIYERYFSVDGKRYHHLLNKTTGYPIENNLYSVTIISDESVDGDALSTITFIKGLEEGLAYIEGKENTEAIFITDQFEVISTSGLTPDVDYEIVSNK